ncbi:MAG: ATP-binding cassette domain-containing protein [Paludibacteraceae bacterium]|nr:ATP-binding cassette domain-containing protein [Paludibacteraceae bacterium]
MAVSIEHLNKHIGAQHVLKDINLNIKDGEVVGLLGPNGAGKSTLMKILVGLWEPDRPASPVRPHSLLDRFLSPHFSEPCGDPEAVRPAFGLLELEVPQTHGYLPEQNPLYPEMYVREYLQFMARLDGVGKDRVETLIERVGLTPEVNKKIGELSKGYRQRVGLAQALLSDPDLLILDEPTTGLDPNQLTEIRQLIRDLGRDRTVILSTHIMQEVSAMCNRVVILDHGEIKADRLIEEVEDLEELFRSSTLNC